MYIYLNKSVYIYVYIYSYTGIVRSESTNFTWIHKLHAQLIQSAGTGTQFCHCNTLQHTATHCNTLHHTASHCSTLQHTITHCNKLHIKPFQSAGNGRNSASATHCNTLQHTATHCNTPQQITCPAHPIGGNW